MKVTKNISQTKQLLRVLLTGSNYKIVPALVGLTGVGKTEAISQLAKELNRKLISFNVAQLQQGDLAMPVALQDIKDESKVKQIVEYNINIKLREALNSDDEYIILLDEFTRGNISVINELMTIINGREIQGNHFGNNVRFILAMNPTSEMHGYEDEDYVATNFDNASSARILMIDVHTSIEDWLKWGKEEVNGETNLHKGIITFFSEPLNHIYFYGKETKGIRMRTPRTWHFVSDIMKDLEKQKLLKDKYLLSSLVASQVGYDVADTFTNFISNLNFDISADDLISENVSEDKFQSFKKLLEVEKVGLCNSAIQKISNHLKNKTLENIFTKKSQDNFAKFLLLFNSVDSQAKVFMDLNNLLGKDLSNQYTMQFLTSIYQNENYAKIYKQLEAYKKSLQGK